VCFCKCDFLWLGLIFMLAIFSSLIPSANAAETQTLGPYRATYMKNYDGDTMTVKLATWHNQTTQATLRLHEIDTPEIKGGCAKSKQLAKDAKKFTHKAMSEAKRIDVLVLAVDNFGRYVAKVIVDNKDISTMLLEARLAKPYIDLKKKPKWCDPNKEERGA